YGRGRHGVPDAQVGDQVVAAGLGVRPGEHPHDGDPLCAVTRDARTTPTIQVGGTVPGIDTAAPTVATTSDGTPLADRVLVPTGRVAVVRVLAGPDAQAGSYHLVTDLGIRYAVAAPAVLPLLGYPADGAVDVPAALLSRIPSGPTLDPRAAVTPATVAAR
ncbi:type VII secretion protein EccB, partial [Micromonospora echinofusca]